MHQRIPVLWNAKSLQVVSDAVFSSETRAFWLLGFLKPAQTKMLGNSVIWHPGDIARPLQPSATNYVRHQLCISPYSPELTYALAAFARRRLCCPAMRASGEIAQPKYTNKLTHFTGWSATINAALSSADVPTPATKHFVLAKLTLRPNA